MTTEPRLWVALLGVAALAAHTLGAASAKPPVPRADENSRIAHEQLVAKARRGGIDLYFLGDSITRRWGTSDAAYRDLLENWNANFHGWNAGNFGWGGDRVEHIRWRIENGELDGVHPKVIVILAGTNNVGREPGDAATIAEVADGLKRLVDACRNQAPRAKIVVTAIFPRNDHPAVMPTIERINEKLAQLEDGATVFFLNVNRRLADSSGRLFPGMMVDQLHPSVRGYQVWADGLKPLLTRFLGPPAATDHAPPPSADPSATAR